MVDRGLTRLIDFVIPKPGEWAEENFAGDPLVKELVEALREVTKCQAPVYVAWACPPRVTVLASSTGHAVIRSERLDTLLVQYHSLAELAQQPVHELVTGRLVGSFVLRWMSELLLGYGQPHAAISALQKKHAAGFHVELSPFRDQTLASIPPLQRAAIQCFSIAHEFGHILFAPKKGVDFDAEIDGISMRRHLTWETEPAEFPILVGNIAPANLFCEFEADRFALETVIRYLLRRFDCRVRDAVEATLRACEATLALNFCMQWCEFLKHRPASADFERRELVAGAQASARSRVVLRRAGMLWAALENPGRSLTVDDFNRFVPRVDGMFIDRIPFMLLVTQTTVAYSHELNNELEGLPASKLRSRLDKQIADIARRGPLRLELYEMLIAFGCDGATDVVSYIRSLVPTAHRPSRPASRVRPKATKSPRAVGRARARRGSER